MPALLLALLLTSSLDRELIKGVIKRADPDVRACYVQALKAEPSLRGKAVMVLEIDAQGAVKQVDVSWSGTPEAPETFRTCLHDAMAALRFPPSKVLGDATIKISWPAVFVP